MVGSPQVNALGWKALCNDIYDHQQRANVRPRYYRGRARSLADKQRWVGILAIVSQSGAVGSIIYGHPIAAAAVSLVAAYWNSCTAMAALLNKLGESLEGWGGGGATRTGHVFCWFKHQPEPEPLANERSAKDIVNAIFSELSGRGGFDILDEVHDDAETYREMHAKCSERVLSAADGDVGKFDDRWNPKEEE